LPAQLLCSRPLESHHTQLSARHSGYQGGAARAKALRRILCAAGVTAPITITTVASSATPAKRTKAVIRVVWGVTP
jgi:hypothetical protein